MGLPPLGVVLELGARMARDVVVQDLHVSLNEFHIVRQLVAEIAAKCQRLLEGLRVAWQFLETLRRADVRASHVHGQVAVAEVEHRKLPPRLLALGDLAAPVTVDGKL
jgi:hypothetical protein